MCQPNAYAIKAWAYHLGVAEEAVDAQSLREQLLRGTIPGALAYAARHHPESTLAVDASSISLAELNEQVGRYATALASRGLTPGSRMVISAAGSLELVATYLAALHAGATVVLLNPAYTDEELAATVTRSRADVLVSDRADPSTVAGAKTYPLLELAEAARDATQHGDATVSSSDLALLAFTSGTTGTPKGVPLTHGQLLASIRGAMCAWRWRSSDRLVHALPLFHQHGLSGVHATLVAGSSATLLTRFEPQALVETVAREDATVVFGVPSIHRRLLELGTDNLEPLRRLRLMTSGSAALAPGLAEQFQAATGIQLLERYGLTETGLNVSNPYDGDRVPGRVGIPLPGVEVSLTDPDGRHVALDEEGEIVLRGPQVFDGYINDPEATAAAFWPGGWFRTGDLGRFDDGRLQVTGRLKDLVITGGMNVSPAEVEAVVEQLPEVQEAAVAGLPSDRWGEEVAVWVVPRGDGIDPERVIAHCREHLASFKCPKRVFEIDALPRNPMGKIVRSQLANESST